MAAPLISMLRRTKMCLPATIRLKRLFASKRKKAQVRRETGNIHMKNLFEAQRTDDSSKGGKPQASSYRDMLDRRHDQALRSVLIRVPMSTHDVCDSLLALGPVKKAFILQKLKNYLLVEFKHKATVDKLLQHTSYFPDASQIPLASRLLYAMQTFHVQRYTSGTSIVPEVVHKRELTTENYLAADRVSSQMQDLHSERQMSDVGSRLRFFMCSLMEDVMGNSMPFCRVEPFGSSSNGFGWEGCDLDMMMSFDPPVSHTQASSKFRFMTKRGSEDERVFGQQCLDVVGEMIRGVMPSTYAVNKVLNARVPIVKFRHEATELDCDLSYFNVSGTKMSELMYLLGEVDPRVRTLMTTIKQWAKSCDLTRSHPGPWPSSFTLLCLLIVFLQTRSPCVLPSLRHLQSLAGAEDHFIIDGVDYAFVTDLSKVARSNNTQCIDELLVEFFHFYSHFDFSSQGLSLIEGSSFPKHDDNPMYIENPLDIGHNISSNVNTAYVGRLQEAMAEAVQCLESNSSPNPDKPWGLLCLFQPPSLVRSAQSAAGYNVTGLFEDGGRADR